MMLNLGWHASDFRRYENAGYRLLCRYVQCLLRIQRIAVVFPIYLTAKTSRVKQVSRSQALEIGTPIVVPLKVSCPFT